MDPNEPRAGDIILYPVTPQSSIASRLVAIGELLLGQGNNQKEYSHVALLEKDGYQLEAIFPKIRRSKINPQRPYEIWRIDELTDAQRAIVLNWAYDKLGEWYNLLYVLSFGLIKIRHEEVCCTYVGDAYAWAGIRFNYTEPDSIANSPKARLILEVRP